MIAAWLFVACGSLACDGSQPTDRLVSGLSREQCHALVVLYERPEPTRKALEAFCLSPESKVYLAGDFLAADYPTKHGAKP